MTYRKNSKLDMRKCFVMMAFMLLLLHTGCNSHYLTKQMLLEQVFPEATLQTKSKPLFVSTPGLLASIPVRYNSNSLSKILCYNEKNQKVYISVNQNSQLIITDKNGGTHKFYLDTVFLENDILYGARSRILGIEKSVSMEDVEKIEIYTELSKETPAEQTGKETSAVQKKGRHAV